MNKLFLVKKIYSEFNDRLFQEIKIDSEASKYKMRCWKKSQQNSI